MISLAPMHDWKDDAEFLRYNRIEPDCVWCNFDPRDPRNQWKLIVIMIVVGSILEIAILRMLGL
jgi:hypothetical protein